MNSVIVAAREEFILLPDLTPMLMYIILIPFAIVFVYGLYRRFKVYGLNLISELNRDRKRKVMALMNYAFLQRKVARGLAGIIHLLIYAAIIILFIGTLLVMLDYDLLRFYDAELLRGNFYLLYELTLDLFGIAYITGLVLALIRRAVIKPEYLQNKREYFIVLIALLYLGITGYIMEGIRIALTDPAWKEWSVIGNMVSLAINSPPLSLYSALWWSHAIVTFSLVAYIPYSSLMHIIFSTLNVMISAPKISGKLSTPFNLLALEESGTFDVKVGINTLQDLGWKEILALEACTNCGRCQNVCPAYASGTPLSPRNIIQKLAKSKDLLNVSDDEIWACTACAACIEACPVLINPLHYIIERRRYLVSAGRLDKKKITLLNNLSMSSNAYGLPASDRATLARELNVPLLRDNPDAEYIYWIGCASTYDPRAKDVAKAFVSILKKAQISFAILGIEERCSGDPARRIGEEGLFQQLALQNIEILKKYNKKIITHCPHCFNTIANEYPEFGGNFEVIHHSVLIKELIRDGRIRVRRDATDVTLHDSCYAGRFNSIYDAPRDILNSISTMKEMRRKKEQSFCCGAGGANYWFDVPRRERISIIRVKEAVETNSEILAVECPYCLQMFNDATKITDSKIRVKDIAEIVAEAME